MGHIWFKVRSVAKMKHFKHGMHYFEFRQQASTTSLSSLNISLLESKIVPKKHTNALKDQSLYMTLRL